MMLTKRFPFMQSPTASYSLIESKAYKAIEILKGQANKPNYHLVGLLLLLQKENVLDQVTSQEPAFIIYELREAMYFFDQFKHLIPVYEAFSDSLLEIEPRRLVQVFEVIKSTDKSSLDIFLKDVIENLVYHISKLEGRLGGVFLQPVELTKFICALADLKEGASVYNPFAGAASFGVHFGENIEYTGQEINRSSWAIGLLRLIASNKFEQADFILGDSIIEWNPLGRKFDLIVGNPPFNLRVDQYNHKADSISDATSFFLKECLKDLTTNGKAIVVAPNSTLSNNGKDNKSLRRFLVNEDLLETVISFPGGLLNNTGIPFNILVINNAKKQRGRVLFVDAGNSLFEASTKQKAIDAQRLLSVLQGESSSEIKIVTQEEIFSNDFNLMVQRYFTKESSGVALGNILKPVKGSKVSQATEGKYVRIKDLSNDTHDFILDTSTIETVSLPKYAVKLEKSAILLAVRWKSLKPTHFVYKGEPIFLSPDILPFEVKGKMIDIAYLCSVLASEDVMTQLDRYRTGATVPYITRLDLLKVKVDLPDLETQRVIITSEASRLLEEERKAIRNRAYEELASIKHSMGKPLLNLNSGVRNIEAALSKISIDWESFKLSSKTEYTLRDAINSLYSNLDLLSNLLRNNKHELDVNTYALNQVEAISFFRRYVGDLKAVDGEKYQLSLDVSPDLETEFKGGVYIHANEELLKIALNNIVDNAQRHGFTRKDQDYKLEIRLNLHLNRSYANLDIEVANNGEPFPEGFSWTNLIRKGATAGPTGNSGIGGHDIDAIVTRLDGRLELYTHPYITAPFTTIYKIYIPIIGSDGYQQYE
ncbi:N-6 DNA methylase [Rufibacter tibetensis]|uniref:site-specific DNA-methyltransferase (adenine-specific) n=1 Tax=Rufibacter tibetensis TaxID=512763 RepID=A0A0P0C186_9BACT|nr:N-6 DNA methylase [Rufibacter tibetensis]ALI98561.1 hypothetical protein DC20_05740 [Rufibacter tibetensis]